MSLKYSSKKTILLRSFLSLLSYFFPKKIISCSFCGVSVHKNIGYSNHKFKVIHNGIDFKKANISLSQDISTRRSLNICSIGRNSPQKNRTYFVSILQELSNFLKINSLIIGRDVTKSNELKKYTLLPNINLNLKESTKNIENIFSEIDILIVTSLYGEGCPNVLIEAIKNGVLVFSTNVGDSRYIIGDDQLIIPNNDSLSAAIKILKVLKSKNINKLINKSRKRSNILFNERKMINEYEKIWNSVN